MPVNTYGRAVGQTTYRIRPQAAEPEAAGGLVGDRVDVRHAVQHLDQHLPERRVDDQQQGRAEVGAVEQHRERDQRDRRDRPQELHRRGGRRPQHRHAPISTPATTPATTAMARPSAQARQGVADAPARTRRWPTSSAERGQDPAGRRQVAGRRPGRAGAAPRPARAASARPGEAEQRRARRSVPRHGRRRHGRSLAQVRRRAAEDAVLRAELGQRLDRRPVDLGRPLRQGQRRRAPSASIFVYVPRTARTSSGCASA